jgi:hypothetical protein
MDLKGENNSVYNYLAPLEDFEITTSIQHMPIYIICALLFYIF